MDEDQPRLTEDADSYFRVERERMVDEQLKTREITDKRVLEAFYKVPRHHFISESHWPKAYEDHPLSIGLGQTISQPYMVALMTQCLELKGHEKVLEIGTGSGYQTAILAELAETIYTVERHQELAEDAQTILDNLGYRNVDYFVDDGSLGCSAHQPFDRILVAAGSPQVPKSLKMQLKNGGLLVIPVGPADGQKLLVITRHGVKFIETQACACMFVKLVGQEGWSEESLKDG